MLVVSWQYLVASHPTPAPSSQVRVTVTLLSVQFPKVCEAPFEVALAEVVGAVASNVQLVLLPELMEFAPAMSMAVALVLFESWTSR